MTKYLDDKGNIIDPGSTWVVNSTNPLGATGWWLGIVNSKRQALPMQADDLLTEDCQIQHFTYFPSEVLAWLRDAKLPEKTV